MNSFAPIEELFAVIDQTAIILRKELHCTYLEAVAETGENLFQDAVLQEELDEVTTKRLKKEYDKIQLLKYPKDTIRKAYQLAILKGMKEATQPHHQMTPDAVSVFIGYLAGKLIEGKKEWSLLDPAVGTGNLLTAVLNHQQSGAARIHGVDVDDLLLKLAYVNANLQEYPVQFFNQDSLQPLFIDPVDLVVCDLPVGYYPDEAAASSYTVKAEEGLSYAHHLFIEQSLNYTKPGGYIVALVPNHLFETEQAEQLRAYLKEEAIIQGLLQLPLSMFQQESAAKSILLLQKRGEGVVQPKQALLADLPKFTNKDAMNKIVKEINAWFEENKR